MSSSESAFQSSFQAFKKTTTGGGGSYFSFQTNQDESQESLMGSFQTRASETMSTIGSSIGLGPANPDADCCGLSSFQVNDFFIDIY